MRNFITKLGMIIALLLSFLPVSTYGFVVDGIIYSESVDSNGTLYASVYSLSPGFDQEDLVIPEKVEYDNEEYNVTEIYDWAFKYCKCLKSITLPNSIESIGSCAFTGCTSLVSINIPTSIKRISGGVFNECTSLANIEIPNSIEFIGDGAFSDCSSLSFIDLPESIEEIERCAFSGCSSLTSIKIPNNITSIAEQLFMNCSSLIDVEIPESVTKIGSFAFSGCSSLDSLKLPESVTVIGGYAFSDCISLKNMTIPNYVRLMGGGVFNGCSALESVSMGFSLQEIGEGAFANCTSLKEIVLGRSVTKLGAYAFENCYNLKSIDFNESLEQIRTGTFINCRSLESMTFPGSINSIVQYYSNYPYGLDDLSLFTFENCNNLNEFIIEYSPNKLVGKCDKSSHNSYSSCDLDFMYMKLERLMIDRELGNDVRLPLLKELEVGEHVEKIQIIPDWSPDLNKITINALNPPTSQEFTMEQYDNIELYVPIESLELYQHTDVWKNFQHIQGFDTSGVEAICNDSIERVVIGRYNMNGQLVSEDYKGVVIVRYSDGSVQKVSKRG